MSVFEMGAVTVEVDSSSTAKGWLNIGLLEIEFVLVAIDTNGDRCEQSSDFKRSSFWLISAPATTARSDDLLKDVGSQVSSVWLKLLMNGGHSLGST